MALKSLRKLTTVLKKSDAFEHHQIPQLKTINKPIFELDLDKAPTDEVIKAKVDGICKNTDQRLMVMTEDKAFICFNRHLRLIGYRRWIQPLSLLTTLLLALATSDFNKLSWISSDLLKATFIVAAAVTTGWLVWEVVTESERRTVPATIQNIFTEMRGI